MNITKYSKSYKSFSSTDGEEPIIYESYLETENGNTTKYTVRKIGDKFHQIKETIDENSKSRVLFDNYTGDNQDTFEESWKYYSNKGFPIESLFNNLYLDDLCLPTKRLGS